jgi:ABC-type cobalamin transport system ATPase subunit
LSVSSIAIWSKPGLAEKPEDYAWSSHKAYLSIAKKWEWLNKVFIYSLLFDIQEYSSLNSSIERMKRQIAVDSRLAKRIERLTIRILKSQKQT